MNGHYKLIEEAQQDLMSIQQFSAQNWGEAQAKRYLEGFRKVFDLIAELPSVGKNCDYSIAESLYCFFHESHAIYYMILEKEVTIIAILHQSMMPKQHLSLRLNG
jgi:toxin ParE1/3/4